MRRNIFIVVLILVIFFAISFLTNILGPIVPALIDSFHLSAGLAGFLPFSFFVAYGVMSIPAGVMAEKYTDKPVLLAAFILAFAGALFFALRPSFGVALTSLFFIGIGMAMLQVVINPLLRVAGGEEHFAFNSVLAQLFFGSASFLSPLMYSYLVQHVHKTDKGILISLLNRLVPNNLTWVSVYWIFAIIALVIILIIWFVRFPKVELKEDEKIETGKILWELFQKRTVILFFIGIFAYVGTEQGIANWTSRFLQTYHQVDPETTGARVISLFWGLMTIGCLLGLLLLKLFDSRKILMTFATGAIIALSFSLSGTKEVALITFPLCGFFASVMWSIIVSLGLNSLPSHQGTFAGILCTGIAGGAVVPLIIGALADFFGLRFAMLFLYLTLGYIFSIGIWARPLVNNKTIDLFTKKSKSSEYR